MKERPWGILVVSLTVVTGLLACTSNVDCNEKFCWTDGKCRDLRQVIMSLKKSEAKKVATHSLRLMDGDRICVTAMLNPLALVLDEFSGTTGTMGPMGITEYGNLPLQMFLYDLRICSSDYSDNHLEEDWIPKTHLRPYDSQHHFSTGCFTKNAQGLYQHVIISHREALNSENREHMKSVQLSNMVHGVVDERDQVSFSSENVAASACFNVRPVGHEDAPVLIQASVVIMLDPSYNTSSNTKEGSFTSMYIKSFGDFGDVMEDKDEEATKHGDLHTCLTNSGSSIRKGGYRENKLTSEEKNARLKHRHRRERFKEFREGDKNAEEEKEEKESCGTTFNRVVSNARVVTVTSEDIVPSGRVNKSQRGADFDYESMQTPPIGDEGGGGGWGEGEEGEEGEDGGLWGSLKHYYYYGGDDGDGYYYYYGHPYYHPHIHCKWSLKFRSGAGICESPHIIYPNTFHGMVIVLATLGIGVGIVCFIMDWQSRALFRK
jgi:hypothetical protein